MPRHYAPDSKAEALQILKSTGGDIAAAHYRTGIPYRTLYTWRQEIWLQQVKQRQTPPQLPQKEPVVFENEIEGLLHLRQQIIGILLKINATPAPQMTSMLVDRVRAQAGLLDCLFKLNDFLRPHLNSRQPSSYWDDAGNDYQPI